MGRLATEVALTQVEKKDDQKKKFLVWDLQQGKKKTIGAKSPFAVANNQLLLIDGFVADQYRPLIDRQADDSTA